MANPVKRRKKIRGLEALEQAAYTRKRLRAEGKWVSRFVELQRDERGYDGEEISTIMAFIQADQLTDTGRRIINIIVGVMWA